MAQGHFITFEGGEGSGKSTQVSLLEEELRRSGHEVVVTREPGGSRGAEEIRDLLVNGEPDRWAPLTEALLLAAARHEHLERTIRPALAQGATVLCDRFYDSSMAYQGYAHDLGPDLIESITKIAVGNSHPDLTLVFDMPVDVGLARAGAREDKEDRYERMGDVFHQRLRAAYKDIAARNAERCVLIDANRSIEDVAQEIWTVVSNRFEL